MTIQISSESSNMPYQITLALGMALANTRFLLDEVLYRLKLVLYLYINAALIVTDVPRDWSLVQKLHACEMDGLVVAQPASAGRRVCNVGGFVPRSTIAGLLFPLFKYRRDSPNSAYIAIILPFGFTHLSTLQFRAAIQRQCTLKRCYWLYLAYRFLHVGSTIL